MIQLYSYAMLLDSCIAIRRQAAELRLHVIEVRCHALLAQAKNFKCTVKLDIWSEWWLACGSSRFIPGGGEGLSKSVGPRRYTRHASDQLSHRQSFSRGPTSADLALDIEQTKY